MICYLFQASGSHLLDPCFDVDGSDKAGRGLPVRQLAAFQQPSTQQFFFEILRRLDFMNMDPWDFLYFSKEANWISRCLGYSGEWKTPWLCRGFSWHLKAIPQTPRLLATEVRKA